MNNSASIFPILYCSRTYVVKKTPSNICHTIQLDRLFEWTVVSVFAILNDHLPIVIDTLGCKYYV